MIRIVHNGRRWVARWAIWLVLMCSLTAQAAVDANHASPHDLMAIKGIGPATSQRIVEARQQRPFADWNDFIDRVKGIGPKRAHTLSANGLTINGQFMPASGPTNDPTASGQALSPRSLIRP